MDRQIIYVGQVPLETDLLNTNKNVMVGLSKLAAALLGTTTLVNGFTCIPTGPASLQVQVTAGEIYILQNIDGTAYSSLAADTAHQIVKQGILLDTVTLNAPAPVTGGQSINYLVQVTYQDTDALPVVLPYYNASNPSVAYSGPANAGTTNNTVRKGVATVAIKAGISAATGSQVTPTVDAGYTPMFVVTVANGQTQVTAPNIVTSGIAPFITETLTQKISQATGDIRYAQLNSPVFIGAPAAPTAPQFDSSTKLSTTAFVKAAGFQFAGNNQYTSTNAVLTDADIGKVVMIGGTGGIITLPLATAAKVGSTILITLQGGTAVINRQGADLISIAATATLTTFTLSGTDHVILECYSAGVWLVVSGTPLFGIGANGAFGASLAASGFKKHPSGEIEQWGTATIIAGGTVNISFPITFPNAVYSIVLGLNSGSPVTGLPGWSSITTSGVTINCSNPAGAGVNASVSYRVNGK
jgi:hypothetical protein